MQERDAMIHSMRQEMDSMRQEYGFRTFRFHLLIMPLA